VSLTACLSLLIFSPQHQLLGYLLWLHAAHYTTPTALSWHLAINAKVFERCMRVVRAPSVLRVCIFATAELLRLARPPQPQVRS
jgi:hypothetical protein